jgi:hypothetical protein
MSGLQSCFKRSEKESVWFLGRFVGGPRLAYSMLARNRVLGWLNFLYPRRTKMQIRKEKKTSTHYPTLVFELDVVVLYLIKELPFWRETMEWTCVLLLYFCIFNLK